MKTYIKPEIKIINTNFNQEILCGSKTKWNDVSSFGPGDKNDKDKTGDDDWDTNWGWGD